MALRAALWPRALALAGALVLCWWGVPRHTGHVVHIVWAPLLQGGWTPNPPPPLHRPRPALGWAAPTHPWGPNSLGVPPFKAPAGGGVQRTARWRTARPESPSFRTEIPVPTSKVQLGPRDGLVLMGSCFADNIGARLQGLKLDVEVAYPHSLHYPG